MLKKGWHKPTDRHKYHYFVEGQSECLRYFWYPLEGEEYDSIRPIWNEEEAEAGDMDLVDLFDSRFCKRCQFCEAFGKSIPPHLPKCRRCGQFTSNPQWHRDHGWYEWDEYCYCERCENETT